MRCDRCNRTIDDDSHVSLGSRRRFKNLCRSCWTVETRSSNSRLIAALNEMSRRADDEQAAAPRNRRGHPDRRDRRDPSRVNEDDAAETPWG